GRRARLFPVSRRGVFPGLYAQRHAGRPDLWPVLLPARGAAVAGARRAADRRPAVPRAAQHAVALRDRRQRDDGPSAATPAEKRAVLSRQLRAALWPAQAASPPAPGAAPVTHPPSAVE